MGELIDYFQKITPAELARLREKDQRLSTRDKERFLKKIAEIEEVVNRMGDKIFINKVLLSLTNIILLDYICK